MDMPRFHPLIHEGEWWIADGWTSPEHSLPGPYLDEPCESYEEALALSAILNEGHE